MKKIVLFTGLFFGALSALISPAYSQVDTASIQELQKSVLELQKTVESLRTTVLSQNEVIRQQSIRISSIEKSPQATPSVVTAGPSAQGPLKTGAALGLNPEIGVNGTVQTKLTQNTSDEDGNDTIALKELEVSFAQAVDPYSRVDATLAYNDNLEDQNVDIEEAYYTRWGLPLGFTGQVGKFRAKIGKENLEHLHQLETTDYALVIQDFFGEEGLASSGARLQNNIPNPWDIPLEVTGEVLRGNNGPSFSGISRRPIFNTHLKSFFETSESSNLELGWTTLFGDQNTPDYVTVNDDDGNPVDVPVTSTKGTDHYGVKVFGADATMNWFLPEGKTVKWQNEIYFQNRDNLVHVNDNPWGFYSLIDYRFSRKFSGGFRFDYLEPLDVVGQHGQTLGVSPYLTFWQSEFANVKLQYSHIEPASGDAKTDNLVYVQVDFQIGAHKHAVQ